MPKRSLRRQRARRPAAARAPMKLIGIDLSEKPAPRSRAPWLRFVLALVVAAGLLVALRVDILRGRYALAEALEREQALLQRHRDLTVEMRRLRDPRRLGERARELGFVRPALVIDLGPTALPRPAPSLQPGAETSGPVLAARP